MSECVCGRERERTREREREREREDKDDCVCDLLEVISCLKCESRRSQTHFTLDSSVNRKCHHYDSSVHHSDSSVNHKHGFDSHS